MIDRLSPSVLCPIHQDQIVSMIDSEQHASQPLYCCLCILECNSQNSLPKTLMTYQDYLTEAAKFYQETKSRIVFGEEAPVEYTEILDQRTTRLNKLANNFNGQKDKVKETFDEIRKSVLGFIQQKENEYVDLIDKEFTVISNTYERFEKVLKAGWPQSEDMAFVCPTREQLGEKLSRANDAKQLQAMIKGIKDDMTFEKLYVDKKGDDDDKEIRKAHLNKLQELLEFMETAPPKIEIEKIKLERIEEFLKEGLINALPEKLPVKHSMSTRISSEVIFNSFAMSVIIKPGDFSLIRSWLPQKYKFQLRLLYRGSIDGMTPKDFHNKCDGKGPTLTLIKCRFNGSDKTSIIGGFTDKSWHSNNCYTASEEAFIFSITTRVKCSLPKGKNAMYGGANDGPIFGGGHDIYVANNLANSSVSPCSYANTAAIVENKNYVGTGSIKFTPEDIEVYSLPFYYKPNAASP